VTLRRRLVVIFLCYLVITVAGTALVLWISAERNQEVERQSALIEEATLDPTERAALMASQERLDELRTQLTVTAVVVLGAALVTTVVAAVLVRRWVTRPIDRVSTAVRDARAGDLGVIAPQGPPEIADLARDVDAMRLAMNQALFDATRARETIEQSASVVLGLRSELAADVVELREGWTVAAELQPAEGVVAGDCYDLIEVGDSSLGMIVVDISGHGSVSGIIALRGKELLRAGLRSGLSPGDALAWASEQLDDLDDETFLSAFVAVVDLDDGRLRYASAGHPPAILCVGDSPTELGHTGPIVGPLPGPWATRDLTMGVGDTIAIYTDGVVEARNRMREEFGTERLADLVCDVSCEDAAAIAKRVIDEIAVFAPDRLADDATIVLLCRGPRHRR
jgi:sigma-B regulation protein RsbU (phosphoserine phosphatase)